VEPVDRPATLPGELVTAIREEPQHGAVVLSADSVEVWLVLGDRRHTRGIDAIGLAPMAVRSCLQAETEDRALISIGIDTHKATLAVSAVDELGRELGSVTVRNDRTGHRQLRRWAAQRGPDRRFGIEGSGSFGAALAQDLVAAGEIVFEVPVTLTDRERRHVREPGKSDPGDALAIARVLVREQSLRRVSRPSLADDPKLLVIARDELVSERTRVANRLHADLLVLAPGHGR
jgi:hypothetical protein